VRVQTPGFVGTVKVKSDPKPEEFKLKNIICRGAVIKSNVVFGIVIFVSQDLALFSS
jgi:ribosomal protein S8E